MSRIAQAFSAAASQYEGAALQQKSIGQQAWEATQVEAQARILDMGCGPGRLAQIAPHHSIIGMDIAAGMCRLAHPLQEATVQADMHALPFADAQFDLVYSALCWQWSNQPEAVAQQIAHILKPKGQMVLATYQQGTLQHLRETYLATNRPSGVLTFRSMAEDTAALEPPRKWNRAPI